MNKLFCSAFILCGVLISVAAFSQGSQPAPATNSPAQQTRATIEGLVRDVACPIQNPEATATHLSMKCLRACARKGSPLVILTKEGELYFPISSQMPDDGQRNRLRPFLGKYVRATGAVYERKGTHAIMIEQMEELKDVPLKIEDQ
jgi:hypothetical protein